MLNSEERPMLAARSLVRTLCLTALVLVPVGGVSAAEDGTPQRHLLYVAEPGIRDYTEYGGHGVLVFDIDHGHRFVRRIEFGGLDAKGKPMNVKGVCASAATGKLYVSTLQSLC